MKKFLSLILVSALGGALTLGAYKLFFENSNDHISIAQQEIPMIIPTDYKPTEVVPVETADFTSIAKQSVNAVVHVKNVSVAPSNNNPLLNFFYGQSADSERSMVVGTGSGVIISSDGYIITNNHVIKGSRKLEVTLNNKTSYDAEIIGKDEPG